MMERLITIAEHATAVIEEKRSKFIADIFYIESVKEAEMILKQTKKKYHDAKHHCYAYILKEDILIKKANDDGEPSGTAGSPILNVLEKNNLCNVLVIVTRYFGGILLGAGGLVRAYTEATTKAVQSATIMEQVEGYEVDVIIPYQEMDRFKYYCNKHKISIGKIEYQEKVSCRIEITKEEWEKLWNRTKQENNIEEKVKYEIIKKKYIRK